MKKMKLALSKNGIDFLVFKPSIFHLYNNCYQAKDIPPYWHRLIHHVRMTRELILSEYRVVYMKKKNQIIGHLVYGNGGSRIVESTKSDLVIGPIWIVPSMRGQGYGSLGIKTILHDLEIPYEYAYEYIERDNTASIHAAEKNDFVCLGEYGEYGVFKRIKRCPDGHLYVYRYAKRNDV